MCVTENRVCREIGLTVVFLKKRYWILGKIQTIKFQNKVTNPKENKVWTAEGRRVTSILGHSKMRWPYLTGRDKTHNVLLERLAKPIHEALKPKDHRSPYNLITWEKTTKYK